MLRVGTNNNAQREQSKAEHQAELRDKFSTSKEPKQQGGNLYVKNLDASTDETALRALVESYGTITSVATPTDEKGRAQRCWLCTRCLARRGHQGGH